MSAEWLTALSTLATFVVIAASAIAAAVQLRHMRHANQLIVLNEVRREIQSADFRSALDFVIHEFGARAQDAAFRDALLHQVPPHAIPEWYQIRDVGNYFDGVAAQMVKHGMVDRELACDWWYSAVVRSWDALAPYVASRRRLLGYPLWEDFEYLVLLCRRFRVNHPAGTYPPGEERLPLPEPWPEASEVAR